MAVALAATQAVIASFTLRDRPLMLGLVIVVMSVVVLAREVGTVIPLLLASGISHAVIFASLAIWFVTSLARPGGDVVTTLARNIDPGWTPAIAGYTRAVTVAWGGFFAAMVIVSGALCAFASREAWSFFVNVLDLPLVALMFLVESLVRRRRFPGRRHVGLRDVLAAMRPGRSR